MSLLNTLQTGKTGLLAAQHSISTTSHNVANALTPGYSRRDADLSISSPINRGGVWVGTGVNVDGVTRGADALLADQQITQSGLASASSTLGGDLALIESRFDETTVSGPRLSVAAFFDSLTQATSDPANAGLRADVAQTGGKVADTLNSTATALGEAADLFDSRLGSSVADVNQLLDGIASLNRQIVAGGGSLEAGDLADTRDLMLRQTADQIGATAHFEADGSATVFVGGHAVVSGAESRQLYLDLPTSGTPLLTVAADDGRIDVSSAAGGAVRGHLDAREAVDGYVADLNTFAQNFATAGNAQSASGYDRYGTAGQDIFSFTPGTEATSISFSSAITADTQLLAFASSPVGAAGDAGNLTQLIALEDQAMVGSQTATDFLSSLTSRVGADIAGARSTADRQAAVVADLDSLAQSLHGVDLDEEATNLITYQTAYQASAKVISTADQLLGTLMDLV